MSKVQVMDHPLIQHKINYIRNEEVGSKEFREIVGEIASLMCYEATRDLKMEDVKIKTPICEMTGKQLSGKSRPWNGRWNVKYDPICKGWTYRSLQRSADIRTGGILLQTAI